MLKKLIITVGTSLSFSLCALAQTPFEFIEDSHDFGTVQEYTPNKGGVNPTWEFKFKNIGKDTIKLSQTDVRAQCGCTTPKISTEPIPPGGTGIVSAMYNSSGRLNGFNKKVTVTYQGKQIKDLLIKGFVIKLDTTKYSDAELKKSARFTTENTSFNVGKVEKGAFITKKLVVKNTGKDTLKILSTQCACACILDKLVAEKKDKTTEVIKYILPGKSALLELTYMPPSVGYNSDIITITTNDKTAPRTAVTFSAQVVESLLDKSPVPVDNNNAPFK